MISLTPAEVGGQSPSQADWSPPEGSNKLARLESLLLGCMTAKIHKYTRGDSIDTLKPDIEPRYQAKFLPALLSQSYMKPILKALWRSWRRLYSQKFWVNTGDLLLHFFLVFILVLTIIMNLFCIYTICRINWWQARQIPQVNKKCLITVLVADLGELTLVMWSTAGVCYS